MSFLDSYKRLDKLCGEIYGKDYGISAYIDDMEKNRRGVFYVQNWDSDLARLKNYRYTRNQIVHDTSVYEEDVCDEDDGMWLDSFRTRIMESTDPISVYLNATKPKTAKKQTQYAQDGAQSDGQGAGQSTRYYGGYDYGSPAVGYSQGKLGDADYLEMLQGKYGELYDPGKAQSEQTAEKRTAATATAQNTWSSGQTDGQGRQNVGFGTSGQKYEADRKRKKSQRKLHGVLKWLFILLLTAAACVIAYYYLGR